MATPPLDWTEISEHSRGLSRLAAGLLSDFHGGEDLAQEAVLRALVAGPTSAPVRSGTAWLRVTVRRLAANEWRSRARRARREEAVARAEAVPSSAEVIERTELCRRVLDALEELPEHYARSLRDHYIGGLSPDQVAERDGLSIHTVRSRIHRGKAALRASFELESGSDDQHWSLALTPLALHAWRAEHVAGAGARIALSRVPSTTLGVVTLMKKLAWAAAIFLAGFMGVEAVSSVLSPDAGPDPRVLADAGDLERSGSILQTPLAGTDPSRTSASMGPAIPSSVEQAPTTTVRGRVVDSDQAPIVVARVSWDGYAVIHRKVALPRSVVTITDIEGRNSVDLPYEPESQWSAEFRGGRFHTNAVLKSSSRDNADLPTLATGVVEAPTVTVEPGKTTRAVFRSPR